MRAPHLDRTSKAPQAQLAGSEAVSHLGGTGNQLRAAKRWRRLFVTAPAARGGHGFSPQDPVHTGDKLDWWFDPQSGTYYPSRRSAAISLPTGRYVLPSAAPSQD